MQEHYIKALLKVSPALPPLQVKDEKVKYSKNIKENLQIKGEAVLYSGLSPPKVDNYSRFVFLSNWKTVNYPMLLLFGPKILFQ